MVRSGRPKWTLCKYAVKFLTGDLARYKGVTGFNAERELFLTRRRGDAEKNVKY
jgi:hypothetical protein